MNKNFKFLYIDENENILSIAYYSATKILEFLSTVGKSNFKITQDTNNFNEDFIIHITKSQIKEKFDFLKDEKIKLNDSFSHILEFWNQL